MIISKQPEGCLFFELVGKMRQKNQKNHRILLVDKVKKG